MKRICFAALLTLSAGAAFAHEPFWWNGAEFQVLLEDDETDGAIGMFTERDTAAVGPPAHIHDDASESFFVLEGDVEFLKGDETIVVPEGEAAFVPRGVNHTFRMLNEDGGKVLIIVTPGGFEGFIRTMGEKGLKIPEDMQQIEEISEQFRQRFTGPPLHAR
jgi:quercetin dioxygenase-like cupin family protein